MTNRLAGESSPYLLQHADNPVDWFPWTGEAFALARQRDLPVFLSVGYAACHWCHVMARESFEDAATAEIMNRYFVNVKVDREERPDIDAVYMRAVTALTGSGGWPMSVFLLPDGTPFLGGTYFPPVRRHGMPSFRELLTAVAAAWRDDRNGLAETGRRLLSHIARGSGPPGAAPGSVPPAQVLRNAAAVLVASRDRERGGWGPAPKFPMPMAIEFLLRMAARGDGDARDTAFGALRAMARGGMHDIVGGGFARYSVDDDWLVPHFEKMLYDNALLAMAYLHAFLLSGEESFRAVCVSTLEFILRELTGPEGGFYSSLDADSGGMEGGYYLWTRAELREAAGDPDLADLAEEAFFAHGGIGDGSPSVLRMSATPGELSRRRGTGEEGLDRDIAALRERLFRARLHRERPRTDDKIVTAWNALAMTAFAEAGRFLDEPRYLAAAAANARFLAGRLFDGGRLMRAWRGGGARHLACLEDHGALVLSLLALYQADPDPEWYRRALSLADDMVSRFSDPGGGFFDTAEDGDALPYRPAETQDNATPSGNALAATALRTLSAFGDRPGWGDRAEKMIAAMGDLMARHPAAFGQWLCAADLAAGPCAEAIVIGDPRDPGRIAMEKVLRGGFRPRVLSLVSGPDIGESAPALLRQKAGVEAGATAWVCRASTCMPPVRDARSLARLLDGDGPDEGPDSREGDQPFIFPS